MSHLASTPRLPEACGRLQLEPAEDVRFSIKRQPGLRKDKSWDGCQGFGDRVVAPASAGFDHVNRQYFGQHGDDYGS